MPQLLLELFSEEIPARMQQGAARDLERMASERLKAAGLTWDALTTYAGPRRLTLVIEGLPTATPDRSEELKGPRANAPEQALEGFLRKTGLTKDQLTERDGVFFAVIDQPGRATAGIVAETVDAIVRAFPWPKSMRWGSGALRWIRPLKRIVAIFDGKVVPFEIDGIASDAITEGHRFLGKGQPIVVNDFADYRRKLEADYVLLDVADRKLKILEAAKAVTAAKGLALVDDDGLLDEVAGLAEWPTPARPGVGRRQSGPSPPPYRSGRRSAQRSRRDRCSRRSFLAAGAQARSWRVRPPSAVSEGHRCREAGFARYSRGRPPGRPSPDRAPRRQNSLWRSGWR